MKHVRLLAAAAGLALAVPAHADPYNFVITGDYNASFTLDSNPTPDDFASGLGFTMWDVPGFPDAVFGIADITFFNAGIGGGMEIDDFWSGAVLLVTDSSQLYSGPESAPIFSTGTYAMTEFGGSGTYTLTISAAGGAVPEPAAWGMLIGGFGLAGAAMRRRQHKTKVAITYTTA